MAKTTKNAKIGTEVKAAAPAPAAYTPPQTPAKTPTPAPAAKTTTQVRNSPLPKPQPAPSPTGGPAKQITHEMIARRAYEISISGSGGSDFDNWIRAERELKGGR
jgi:hypothetical protein